MELEFLSVNNASILSDFECGQKEMDVYIHNGLQQSIDGHYCRMFIVKRDNNEIVAFFALSFDSLDLTYQEAYDVIHREKKPIDIPIEYEDTFKLKQSFPAIEISYLAVKKQYRKQGLGTLILSHIIEMAKKQPIAGCQFITVMAYHTRGYSAVGFYRKRGFTKVKQLAESDTIRMFTPVYIYNFSV